jgi:hypothetical protein
MQPQKSRKHLWFIIAITLVISSIPYFLGYLISDKEHSFNGFVIDVEDGNAYLSKMMTGYDGNWLHPSRYSTFPQKGLLIHLPYLWLGKLAGGNGIHAQLIALFHMYRAISLVIYSFGLYRFLQFFIKKERNRVTGVVLGIWGGGLGWIFILPGLSKFVNYVPLEFYSPEVFGFLAILAFPHIVMARGLMLFAISEFLQQRTNQVSVKSQWKTGLYLFLAGICQPLNAAVGILVIAIAQLIISWKENGKSKGEWAAPMVIPAIGAGFWLGYVGWISFTDTYFKAWSQQNQFYSPKIVEFILAYALVVLYIAINYDKLRVANNDMLQIPIIWILLIPVLAYLPSELQRRFPEGSWCAVVVVLMAIFDQLEERENSRHQLYLSTALCFSSIVVLIIISLGVLQKSNQQFISQGWKKSFEFLEVNGYSGNVLSEYEYGNLLPAWTNLTSVIGLKPETIHFGKVKQDMDTFYSSISNNSVRLQLLKKYQIGLVVLDMNNPENMQIDLSTIGCTQQLYFEDNLQIFSTRGCLQ